MGRKKAKSLTLVDSHSAPGSYLQLSAASGAVTLGAQATATTVAPPPMGLLANMPQQQPKKTRSGSADTAGARWGHMKAPVLTTELKRELLMVKMRGALDPKRFYRSADDGKALPKYFQMGTMVEGAEDGSNRLTKRERKGSMLGEIMSDEAIRKRAKTQFLKSQQAASEGVRRRFKPVRKKAGNSKRRS